MKHALAFVVMKLVALATLVASSPTGCASWFPPDPKCQGDPARKPCTCMDPRTPGCPPVPNDNAKKPDGGTDR